MNDALSGESFTVSFHDGASKAFDFRCRNLVVAGWAGRDEAAIEHHIQELEAIGVRRPRSVPLFYRVASTLFTTSSDIQIPGEYSSGEAEAVLLKQGRDLYVGIGSDHTDRKVETYGVTISKQVCAKPVGPELWLYNDVESHWDRLVLRSYVLKDGERILYQEGHLASLRAPSDLLSLYEQEGNSFDSGTAMLCGTVPVRGGFQPSQSFEIELEDPVLNRSLKHSYTVTSLAIAD